MSGGAPERREAPGSGGSAAGPAVARVSVARLEGVGYTYHRGTPFARTALADVDVDVTAGRVTAVIGPTAAGKSTLLEILAGLARPQSGRRAGPPPREVGMVFQRPETQLFAATVWEDVAVGPSLHDVPARLVNRRVEEALRRVGLDPATFGPRRPHQLSLGEQRRVALAGVLALEPRLLVLDEPGSGLDPAGRREVLRRVVAWAEDDSAGVSRTLVFSSHDPEEVAVLADEVLVLAGGRCVAAGPTREVLGRRELLEDLGLRPPLAGRVAARLGLTCPDGRLPVTAAQLSRCLEEPV